LDADSTGRISGSKSDLEYKEIPFLPVKGYASFIENFGDEYRFDGLDTYRVLASVVDHIKDSVVIEIEGNSMAKQLKHGTKVLAVPVSQGNWEYLSGGVYAVLFNGNLWVKRIRENELSTKGFLTVHSDNPDYGSINIQGSEIRAIWKIIEVVSGKVE
jgi:repressor LexA